MIYIAGDHYTVDQMKLIERYLSGNSIDFTNVGSIDSEQKMPLQTMIPAVAKPIQDEAASSGILVCGTGTGVEIGANRFKGIRAALCVSPKQAEFAKVYDNANVLCLSSWLTQDPTDILKEWFSNEFDRDPKRTQMIADFDKWS